MPEAEGMSAATDGGSPATIRFGRNRGSVRPPLTCQPSRFTGNGSSRPVLYSATVGEVILKP